MRTLLDSQIVNHYEGNCALTSKFGLAHTLKSLIFHENINCHEFYPRCFDLFDKTEFNDFLEDYKITEAESILKKFIRENQNPATPLEQLRIRIAISAVLKKQKNIYEKLTDFVSSDTLSLSPAKISLSINIYLRVYQLSAQMADPCSTSP